MKVVVPHHKTQTEAQAAVDKASGDLFGISGPVHLADQKKAWRGPVMDFSFAAKYGFISVPIQGTVTVDDQNITIESELPKASEAVCGRRKGPRGGREEAGWPSWLTVGCGGERLRSAAVFLYTNAPPETASGQDSPMPASHGERKRSSAR